MGWEQIRREMNDPLEPLEPNEQPHTLTVTISRRTIFFVLAVIVIVWLAFKLASLLVVVFIAIVLATAVDQPVSWLARRRVPRAVGVLVIYLALICAAAGAIAVLVPLINNEYDSLSQQIPGYAKQLQAFVHQIDPNLSLGTGGNISTQKVASTASQNLGSIAGHVTKVVVETGHSLVLALAMFIIAYFLAVDPTMGTRLIERFVPANLQERFGSVGHRVRDRIGAWARGQVIIAVSFGAALGLGLWLIGVPYAVSLGLIAAVLEIVPYVGGFITAVLASLMAITVGWPQLVAVLILYTVLVLLESHVMAPIFLGHAVGLPSVAVLVALLVGAELRGIVGILLSVPATVIIWAIVEEAWPPPHPRPRRQVPVRFRRRVKLTDDDK